MAAKHVDELSHMEKDGEGKVKYKLCFRLLKCTCNFYVIALHINVYFYCLFYYMY